MLVKLDKFEKKLIIFSNRGNNRPGGWFFAPYESDAGLCTFGWLMATDLRGWLPQTVIDQVLPTTMLDFYHYLKIHVENNLKTKVDEQGQS